MERQACIGLLASDLERQLIDSRNGLKMGTVRQSCGQYGITIKQSGRNVLLSAPRDRLQILVERMHFCAIKYVVVS